MRKTLILALTAIFILGMSGTAFAGGWWKENPNDTINTVANNGTSETDPNTSNPYNSDWYWVNQSDDVTAQSPHGGFSTTTNKCKTCHAVHGALDTSFRLLKNSSRATECDYCHIGASGASQYRLYVMDEIYGYADGGTADVQGEHTLYSTIVPDSNIVGEGTRTASEDASTGTLLDRGAEGLYCYHCHSVHGAYTITNDDAGWWTRRILRSNPAGLTGYDANDGLSNTNLTVTGLGTTMSTDAETVATQAMSSTGDGAGVRTAFCGGCHNKNANWRDNQDNGQDYSLQFGSHPLNTDGTLEVGGGAGVSGTQKVAAFSTDGGGTGNDLAYTDVYGNSKTTAQRATWCASCHKSAIEAGIAPVASRDAEEISNDYAGRSGQDFSGTYGDPWNSPTAFPFRAAGFPHQSLGPKLLFDDSYTTTRDPSQTNDALESFNEMDKVCGKCHTNTGEFNSGGGQGTNYIGPGGASDDGNNFAW